MNSSPTHTPARERDSRDIDALLLRSITRWSLLLSVLVIVFDMLVLRGYPFPVDAPALRGVFYTAGGIALLLAVGFTTFLGYRIVTTRFSRSGAQQFIVFLPCLLSVSSLLAALFLSTPA